jgi:hypothetical protein
MAISEPSVFITLLSTVLVVAYQTAPPVFTTSGDVPFNMPCLEKLS